MFTGWMDERIAQEVLRVVHPAAIELASCEASSQQDAVLDSLHTDLAASVRATVRRTAGDSRDRI